MRRGLLPVAALACVGAGPGGGEDWRWLGFVPGTGAHAAVYFDAAGSHMNTVDSAVMFVAVVEPEPARRIVRTTYDLDCTTLFGTAKPSEATAATPREPVNLGLLTPYGAASWALCHRLPLAVGQPAGDLMADAAARPVSELQRLDAELLASRSATSVLEKWCGELRLAANPRIRAEVERFRILGDNRIRRKLGVGKREFLGYRRVRLMCGDHMLSQAENWFVPSRLTPDMNAALDGSDAAFGTVIRPLSPSRTTESHRLNLWHGRFPPWPGVLTHKAIVRDGQGRPIAYVIENYQRVLVTGRD